MLPSYRNQSIDLQCKSIAWFLYDGYNDLSTISLHWFLHPLKHLGDCSYLILLKYQSQIWGRSNRNIANKYMFKLNDKASNAEKKNLSYTTTLSDSLLLSLNMLMSVKIILALFSLHLPTTIDKQKAFSLYACHLNMFQELLFPFFPYFFAQYLFCVHTKLCKQNYSLDL